MARLLKDFQDFKDLQDFIGSTCFYYIEFDFINFDSRFFRMDSRKTLLNLTLDIKRKDWYFLRQSKWTDLINLKIKSFSFFYLSN